MFFLSFERFFYRFVSCFQLPEASWQKDSPSGTLGTEVESARYEEGWLGREAQDGGMQHGRLEDASIPSESVGAEGGVFRYSSWFFNRRMILPAFAHWKLSSGLRLLVESHTFNDLRISA